MKVEINQKKFEIKIDGGVVYFPPTEFDLLCALVGAGGNVLSRQFLIDRVWGGSVLGVRTVDQHVHRLRIKLGKKAIMTVQRRGYRYTGK